MAQGVQAIHAWQADIEQSQVWRISVGYCQGIFSVSSSSDRITGLLEVKGQAATQESIIIYEQDALGHVLTISSKFPGWSS
jgi:hypothetical protein